MSDITTGTSHQEKCSWCLGDAKYEHYHDTEWGVPQKDDRVLFEKISLEGFQAGLSWITILRKRDNFRKTFDNFDLNAVSTYNEDHTEKKDAQETHARVPSKRGHCVGHIACRNLGRNFRS